MDIKVSLKDVCEQIFGMTYQNYYELAKDGKLPSPEKGMIDLWVAIPKFMEFDRGKREYVEGKGLTVERERLTKAQADMAEIALKELDGKLVKVDDVKTQWTGIVRDIRSKLLALPSKVVTLLPITDKEKAYKIIKERVYEALKELAGEVSIDDNTSEIGDSGKGDVQSAVGLKSKRVGRRKKDVKPRSKRRAG
jgi:hypothetical protein